MIDNYNKITVLVADDSYEIRLIHKMYLENLGLCVDTAENGAVAYDKFVMNFNTAAKYNLVCIDYNMPIMNGVQSVQKMRAYEAEHGNGLFVTPVCFVSSHFYIHQIVNETLGLNRYTKVLNKPTNLHLFDSIVRNLQSLTTGSLGELNHGT